MLVEKGLKNIILTRGEENYKEQIKSAEEILKYNEEYGNICNTPKDVNEIRKIMDERKILRQ